MELNCKSIGKAWPQVVARVIVGGSDQPVWVDGIYTETKELRSPLMVNIDQPIVDMVAKGCGWGELALEQYADGIIHGTNPGFDYSYGERLRSYQMAFDQLKRVYLDLCRDETSRQEIMLTWDPMSDLGTKLHKPCLCILDVKVRAGHVNLTAYFRSHDAFKAWPVNAYGLARLQQWLASDRWEVGRLTIISNALHIYKSDIPDAIRAAGSIP